MKKIILVNPHGVCAGVARALEIAQTVLATYPKPVYCLKELVHNRQIIEALARQGLVFVHDLKKVPPKAAILFSAHGVPPATRAAAAARGLNIIDATCPFVAKVHAAGRRYAARDYTILLIGYRRHDELIGVAGEAPDRVTVIETEADARSVRIADPAKVAVMMQTTLNSEQADSILAILRARFPGLQTPPASNICYATRNRQQAVRVLARATKAVIVVGSENSSNSNRLVEVARAEGVPAYLVSAQEQIADLPLGKVTAVGLTAGASTPEHLVRETIDQLRQRGFEHLEELTVVREDIHFARPRHRQERPLAAGAKHP